ncbi:MAG TPA: GNAT family N-acetyltransferase [Chloroflexota bacterium]
MRRHPASRWSAWWACSRLGTKCRRRYCAAGKDIVQLKRMRVAPEWQRHGIGRRLLETAIAWAREHGSHAVILDTTEEQAAAIALYRSAGFLPVGRSTLGVYTLLWFELLLQPADLDGTRA